MDFCPALLSCKSVKFLGKDYFGYKKRVQGETRQVFQREIHGCYYTDNV